MPWLQTKHSDGMANVRGVGTLAAFDGRDAAYRDRLVDGLKNKGGLSGVGCEGKRWAARGRGGLENVQVV